MLKHGSAAGTASLVLALLLSGPAAVPARADDAAQLYQLVVPMRSASEADRTAAFGEALRTVAVRISGARDAGTRPAIASATGNPARYVQQYAARSNHTLKVGFDPRAVEQLVLDAGLPVWPAERPATLVLLYVPSAAGGARAVLASEAVAERSELEKAAGARGIRLVWPVTEVPASATRDGDRLRSLGSTAGASRQSALLIGTAQADIVDWRYVPLEGEPATREGAAAEGAHLAADALAERYATPSTRDLARQSIVVTGITDLGAYAEVLRYLDSLSLVRHVDIDEANAKTLRLGVTMRGDRALLARIVQLGDVLSVASAAADGADTDFVYTQ